MRTFVLLLSTVLLLSIALPGADETGYIKARGKPGNAGMFVDGKYVGPVTRFTVPEKYAVEPGEREITLKDPRYEDFTTKVTVRPGKTTKLSFKLKPVEPAKPPFGRLRFGGDGSESFISVTAGDTGAVYINDKFYGYIDELNNAGGGLLLNPGTYNLRVSSQKFGEITRSITIQANTVTVVPLMK